MQIASVDGARMNDVACELQAGHLDRHAWTQPGNAKGPNVLWPNPNDTVTDQRHQRPAVTTFTDRGDPLTRLGPISIR